MTHVHGQAMVPEADRKNKLVAGLLAILLGYLGIHHFYLGNTTRGIWYIIFCWTLIPGLLGLIEGISYLVMSTETFDRKFNTIPLG